jgi:hypothetical protein
VCEQELGHHPWRVEPPWQAKTPHPHRHQAGPGQPLPNHHRRAAGATWLGLNTAFGYFGFCVAGALIIAALPGGGRRTAGLGGFSEESAGIGTVQAFALACGFLFVSLYSGGPVPLAARGLAAVFARVGPAGAVGPRLVRPRRRCGPRGRMCERGRSWTRSLGATGSSLPHRGT